MRELPFSIPISGVIRVDENLVTIVVNRTETTISLETGIAAGKRISLEKYPELKRGSFLSRVIASTPDHPSYKHHKSGRDYLSRIGEGLYWLDERYVLDKTPDKGNAKNQRKLSTDG
jgi:hypothetical protein